MSDLLFVGVMVAVFAFCALFIPLLKRD